MRDGTLGAMLGAVGGDAQRRAQKFSIFDDMYPGDPGAPPGFNDSNLYHNPWNPMFHSEDRGYRGTRNFFDMQEFLREHAAKPGP